MFPYIVNRQMYGQPNGSGKVTSITEPVTVSFNVATNVAPVVSGPEGVSLPHSGSLAFTGANAIAVSDVDAADEESIALTVTTGTLTADFRGVLASHVEVIAGANGTSTMTLKGGISLLNAALATLIYTAPASGAAATLTVQANDGGAVSLAAATLTGSGTSWTVGDLSSLTAADGAYVLTLVASGSGIVDGDGGGLTANASRSWMLDTSITVAAGQTVTDATAYGGGFQLVKRGAGTLVLSGASSHSGGTRVEAGEVVVRNVAALGTGAVWVSDGATLTLDIGTAGVSLAALTPAAGGLLDVGLGRVVIAANGITEDVIRARLAAGRGDGSWNGTAGILSRQSSAVPGGGVGWMVAGDGSFMVGFAAAGDTNLDYILDILDAANMAAAGCYNSDNRAGWFEGDFNADSIVDILDVAEFVSYSLYNAGSYLPAGRMNASFPAAVEQTATEAAFAMLVPETTSPAVKKRKAFVAFI